MTADDGLTEGQALKAAGQKAAEEKASEWSSLARAWIEERAKQPGTFTSDDLVAAVGLPTRVVKSNANSAVGTAFSKAAGRLLRDTGRRVPSVRPSNHAAELTVWIGAEFTTTTKIALDRCLVILTDATTVSDADLVPLLRVRRIVLEELEG